MADNETGESEGDARDEIHEPEPQLRHGVPQAFDPMGVELLFPNADQLLDLIETLGHEGFAMLLDVCGADYLTHPGRTTLPDGVTPERFEVVYTLVSHVERRRLRLRVQVAESDPTVPSVAHMHPGAENAERETYDMFGIVFADHPDLSRILLPDDWEGHPLRKDFAVGRIPVQFKGAPAPR